MTDKEVMQMALDALNNFDQGNHGMRWQVTVIKALRAALARAVMMDQTSHDVRRREWVSLTKEELAEISEFHFHGALSGREFYDDIEAKLKEKNT
jgi:hypothetical protein